MGLRIQLRPSHRPMLPGECEWPPACGASGTGEKEAGLSRTVVAGIKALQHQTWKRPTKIRMSRPLDECVLRGFSRPLLFGCVLLAQLWLREPQAQKPHPSWALLCPPPWKATLEGRALGKTVVIRSPSEGRAGYKEPIGPACPGLQGRPGCGLPEAIHLLSSIPLGSSAIPEVSNKSYWCLSPLALPRAACLDSFA